MEGQTRQRKCCGLCIVPATPQAKQQRVQLSITFGETSSWSHSVVCGFNRSTVQERATHHHQKTCREMVYFASAAMHMQLTRDEKMLLNPRPACYLRRSTETCNIFTSLPKHMYVQDDLSAITRPNSSILESECNSSEEEARVRVLGPSRYTLYRQLQRRPVGTCLVTHRQHAELSQDSIVTGILTV
jgi:hypothetical protein